jgi:hypothetical protein
VLPWRACFRVSGVRSNGQARICREGSRREADRAGECGNRHAGPAVIGSASLRQPTNNPAQTLRPGLPAPPVIHHSPMTYAPRATDSRRLPSPAPPRSARELKAESRRPMASPITNMIIRGVCPNDRLDRLRFLAEMARIYRMPRDDMIILGPRARKGGSPEASPSRPAGEAPAATDRLETGPPFTAAGGVFCVPPAAAGTSSCRASSSESRRPSSPSWRAAGSSAAGRPCPGRPFAS